MAAQTGSTYISGTMIDSVEIPTAKRGFSTTTSSNQVPTTECDNHRQPEIVIWPPKPEVLISLTVIDSVEIPTAKRGFSTTTSSEQTRGRGGEKGRGGPPNANSWIRPCGKEGEEREGERRGGRSREGHMIITRITLHISLHKIVPYLECPKSLGPLEHYMRLK